MIKFEGVSFTYPNGKLALVDINLEIKKGELVAIMGENGSGKTTLAKHMNGLLKPSKGIVKIFGKDTRKESVASLSRLVGLVFQNPDHQLFCDNVDEEVMFGLRNFGFSDNKAKERVNEVLSYFSLVEYRKRSPLNLSGGEKKRLCLACILAWEPEVIILDEPTVGQDYIEKVKLQELIKSLVSKEKTVIIISHDVEFVWPLQPRVVVMKKGKIIADNNAKDVFSNEQLVSEARLLEPQLLRLCKFLKINTATNAREFVEEIVKRWL
jgi:energy-coupling factor transport system ATP-binding protein